jgi:hypothetical protein
VQHDTHAFHGVLRGGKSPKRGGKRKSEKKEFLENRKNPPLAYIKRKDTLRPTVGWIREDQGPRSKQRIRGTFSQEMIRHAHAMKSIRGAS